MSADYLTAVLNFQLTPSQWGLELGPKPAFILTAEQRMWNMIMGIAAGNDASAALQWLVQYCSPDMEGLQDNSDAIATFFNNTLPPGTVSATSPAPQLDDAFVAETIDTSMDMDMELYSSDYPLPDGDSDLGVTEQSPPPPPSTAPVAPSDRSPSPQTTPNSPARSESPLSELTSSDSDTAEDETVFEEAAAPAAQRIKSSTREIKPPKIYTSGASLTHAPAVKKRKLEIEAPTLPGMPPLSVKRETLFWTSAFDYVSAAVSFRHGFRSPTDLTLTLGARNLTELSSHREEKKEATLQNPHQGKSRRLMPNNQHSSSDSAVGQGCESSHI